MSTRAIHMIRHGLTEGNLRRLYYGITDLPLTEQGYAELAKLKAAGIYPDISGCLLYTSGMLRTEQTLTAIYGDLPRQTLPDLRELSFGIFEMYGYEDLKDREDFQCYVNDHTLDRQAPGGERRCDFRARTRRCLDQLLRDTQEDALIVTHGGVIGSLLLELFPDQEKGFHDWLPEPGHGFSLAFAGLEPHSWRRF